MAHEPKYRHPSGVSLDPHGVDEVIQIDTNDELFGDATADDIGAIAVEMAVLLRAVSRHGTDSWLVAVVRALNRYYAAIGVQMVAEADLIGRTIVTRNSIV